MNQSQPFPLELIQIASACDAAWEAMEGDERQRLCAHCNLHVYNLSDMTRQEAEQFMQQRGGRTCVRMFRRHDGTVLTRDCPVGLKALRQRLVRGVAALAGLLLALVGGTLFGGIVNRLKPTGLHAPSEAFSNWVQPQPPVELLMGDVAMGRMAPPPVSLAPVLEPAESPLPEPTAEQLEEISRRE